MQISALPFSFNLYLGRNSYVIQKFRCEAEKEHLRIFSTVCNKIYQRTYEPGKTWGLKSKPIFFSAYLSTHQRNNSFYSIAAIFEGQVVPQHNLRVVFAL